MAVVPQLFGMLHVGDLKGEKLEKSWFLHLNGPLARQVEGAGEHQIREPQVKTTDKATIGVKIYTISDLPCIFVLYRLICILSMQQTRQEDKEQAIYYFVDGQDPKIRTLVDCLQITSKLKIRSNNMHTSESKYLGDLRVESRHNASGNILQTDAPADNNGKGEAFSPTDLLATSLANCMMTIMGIKAGQEGIDLKGMAATTIKKMQPAPRKVVEVEISITLPKGLSLTQHQREMLEKAARGCPVAMSLHPDLDQRVTFIYP